MVVLGAALLLAGVSPCLGQVTNTIFIQNPSFETPAQNSTHIFLQTTGAGGPTSYCPPWTNTTANGGIGATLYQQAGLTNTDGNQVIQFFSVPGSGYAGQQVMYQVLTNHWIAGAIYQYTIAVGASTGANCASGCSISLDTLNGTTLSAVASTAIPATSYGLVNYSVSYTATGSEAGDGRVVIAINQPAQTGSNPYLLFDKAALNYIVPLDPFILAQPVSVTNIAGSAASFTVSAVGTPPLSYQWQAGPIGGPYTNLANVAPFSGTDTNVLTIAGAAPNYALAYQVIVTGAGGSITSAPASLTVLSPALINLDIGVGPTQTGAAVLGTAGDVWNAVTGNTSPLKDSANNTLSGVGFTIANQAGVNANNAAGSAMDAATTALMQDYAYMNNNGPINLSFTGLAPYNNCPFTLVVYAAGDAAGQGGIIAITGGATGLNTNNATVTSVTRQLSAGNGVAYQTFTGVLNGNTLSLTDTRLAGQQFGGLNGLQLRLSSLMIATQPISQTNSQGSTVVLAVGALGTGTLSYQWQATNSGTGTFTNLTEGGQIAGSQSNVLTIANLTTNNNLVYQVIVSNGGGSVTSSPALLTVQTSPVITSQPTSQISLIGNPISFNVTALGSLPLSYQWQANGGSGYTNLADGGQIAGSGTNVLTISNVSSNWALSYRVIVSNGYGSVTSAPAATLTVYPNTLNLNVDFGSGATQSGAAALGTAGEVWNAVTATTGTLVNAAGNNLGGVGLNLTSSGVFTDTGGSAMDAGTSPLMQDYAFGNGSTVTVSFTGLAPYTNSPFTLVVYSAGNNSGQGGSLTLTGATGGNTAGVLNTSGTSRQISAGPGVAYNAFTGVLTNGTLTLNCARLTGQQFTELNGLQLRFAPATNDPTLLVAPVSQTVPAGSTAAFNVTAAGTSPFSYQWQVNNGTGFTNLTNGGQISGATTNVLTISGVAASYVQPNWNWAGNYRVIVTNSVGSVTSAPATLSIVATGAYVPPGGDANGAINAAYSAGGGTVNLGPGTYYGNINMWANVTLNGAGSNTVIAGTVTQATTDSSGFYRDNITIQNLVIDGMISCSSFSVGGSGAAGIYFGGYYPVDTHNLTFNNVEVKNTSIAMQIVNASGVTLNHCNFHDNGIGFSHSIYFTGDYGVTMNHCISSWSRTGTGAHLDFVSDIGVPNNFTQSEFNGEAGNGLLNQAWNGTAPALQVNGCKIQFCGQSGGEGSGVDTDGGGYIASSRLEFNHGYGANIRDGVGLFYDYFNGNSTDWFWTHGPVAAVASGSTPNVYDACLADGVTGPDNTGDWVTGFGGQTEGAVSFANHPTDGAITWSIVSSTVNGSRPLNFKYSNGTSSNLTMQVIVNGGISNNVTFPPTGGWSTYANASLTATNLTTQNNNVRVQLAYPGATSPILAALSVNDSVPGAPAAPTGLTYLALTNAPKYDLSAWIQLNWNPVPGATCYYILRNGLWLAMNVTNNSFVDKHVWTSGSAQNYTIIAVNAGGSSGSAITAYSLTGFPISLSASANGPGSVVLNCNGSANAQFYSAYRATNANGPFTFIGNSGNTTFVDNLAPGGTVYYYMTANNGLTESLSSPLASANVTPIALAITNQPAPQTNSVGGNVAFTVGVTGYPVLTYQWQAGPPGGPYTNLINGGIFSGVTNATLNLTGITTNQALTYRVIVTNSQGSVTSAPPAALTVNLFPTITNQPASQTVFGGRNASFTVGAVGVAPLSYQWQSGPVGGPYVNLGNGGKFSGTTSNVLTIASVTTNQMQAYRVIVSNSYGAVTSSPALLTVQTTLLIDVDIGSAANVQTGPAVLGGAGDIWNGVTTATSTIKDTTGTTLSGVGYAVAGYTGFNDQAAGSPHAVLDAATTPLMRDCVYGQNATFTVSLTGLSGYTNCAFTLVVYGSVGDPNQGDNLTLSGATGGNTASTLTTTGASRSITNVPPNGGLGVTYQTFTGTLTSGTLTITCANNGNTFGGVNGFQLQVIAPAPTISANANLSSLTLSPAGTLSPAFSPNGLSYTATEAYGNSPTVTVVNADLTATNRLIYNNATNLLASGAASAPLALTLGATNVMSVEVTAQDGVTKKTYTVNVTQLPSQTKPVLTNSLSAGVVTLSWPGDHLGYRLLVQTNNLNLGLSSNPNDWTTLPGSATTTTTNFPIVTTNSSGFYRLVYP